MQDLGAAGLTSSAIESANRGGTGIVIDVAKVPRREEGMTPYEVMLSESQERMLIIVRKRARGRRRGAVRALGGALRRSSATSPTTGIAHIMRRR